MNLSIIIKQNSPPGFFIEIPTTFLSCPLIGHHSKYTNYDTTYFLQPKVTLTALKIDLTSFFHFVPICGIDLSWHTSSRLQTSLDQASITLHTSSNHKSQQNCNKWFNFLFPLKLFQSVFNLLHGPFLTHSYGFPRSCIYNYR